MATPSKSTRIVVSAADIAAGVRESFDACPVALAVMRATGANWIRVSPQFGHVRFGMDMGGGCGWSARGNLLPRMVDWVDAFDDGQDVRPTFMQLVWQDVEYRL